MFRIFVSGMQVTTKNLSTKSCVMDIKNRVMEIKSIYRILPIAIFVVGCGGGSSSDGGNSSADVNATEVEQAELVEQRCLEKDEELGVVRPDGWEASSHCQYAADDIERVFPQDKVSKLAITMRADDYASMQVNLDELLGDFGSNFGVGYSDSDSVYTDTEFFGEDECEGLSIGDACSVFGDDGMCTTIRESFPAPDEVDDAGTDLSEGAFADIVFCLPESGYGYSDYVQFGSPEAITTDPCGGQAAGNACIQGEHAGVCAQTTGPMICQVDEYDSADGIEYTPPDYAAKFYEGKPSYYRADIEFDGTFFSSVGIRYKGNSSLAFSSSEKKPLRIKMDEWEDDSPELKNQRMFGFQSLSLSPNETDPTNLHQVLAAATFRENGVPAPQSSFVEVTLDIGDGPELLGLYAMTEIPDDPLLDRIFDNNDGNLYKPDGQGAHFVSFVEESFHVKSSDDSDYADVNKFINALNASRVDRAAWRAELESAFDVEGFIDFLAVNQLIGNWDTYGALAHNFYFYTDEQDEQISFIPWDFDLSFDSSPFSDFTLRSFGGTWPLLQAIARDVEYATLYQERLAAIGQAEFATGTMKQRIDSYTALIEDAVAREAALNRESDGFNGFYGPVNFADSITRIRQHVDIQEAALADFLETQTQTADTTLFSAPASSSQVPGRVPLSRQAAELRSKLLNASSISNSRSNAGTQEFGAESD